MIEFLKNLVRSPYHFALTFFAAVTSGFPAQNLVVIGVGGTKGKSTVSEMIFTILSAAGHRTALIGTIRFAVGTDSVPNKLKMTMPGRGFIQRFLARALKSGATHAVIELTTEGARQHRHRFLYPDVVVMTNVQREHIESHGSFEKYVDRKWELVRSLESSPKKNRAIVVNTDDEWNAAFQSAQVDTVLPYSVHDAHNIVTADTSVSFSYRGKRVTLPFPGSFTAANAIAALKVAEHLGIDTDVAVSALQQMTVIRGRVERVDEGQHFSVIVDYAHTPDSLRALYGAFEGKKICVLGNTGGGRDRWKRPQMAAIADDMCDSVILTNEDPYDEDPRAIVDEMAAGTTRVPTIILDRRAAIREALARADKGDTVLVTGKGTDPYIMGPRGSREPWDDVRVVREELRTLLESKK